MKVQMEKKLDGIFVPTGSIHVIGNGFDGVASMIYLGDGFMDIIPNQDHPLICYGDLFLQVDKQERDILIWYTIAPYVGMGSISIIDDVAVKYVGSKAVIDTLEATNYHLDSAERAVIKMRASTIEARRLNGNLDSAADNIKLEISWNPFVSNHLKWDTSFK